MDFEFKKECWGTAQAPAWAEEIFVGVEPHPEDLSSGTPALITMVAYAVGSGRRRAIIDHDIVHSVLAYDPEMRVREMSLVDPMSIAGRQKILDYANREYDREDGGKLRPKKTFVDCGWKSKEVMEFAASPEARHAGIHAVRFSVHPHAFPPKLSHSRRLNSPGTEFITVGHEPLVSGLNATFVSGQWAINRMLVTGRSRFLVSFITEKDGPSRTGLALAFAAESYQGTRKPMTSGSDPSATGDTSDLEDRVAALEERLAAFEQVGPDHSWSEHIQFSPGAEVVFGGQRFRLIGEDAA